MITWLVFLLCLIILLLIMEICTTGWEILSYRIYSESTSAVVKDKILLKNPRSKALVEQSTDGINFERIKATEDREAGYFPFQFLLFEKSKNLYIFEWTADGMTYRGHYKHLKHKDEWKVGEIVTLRYKKNQPWKYAIHDQTVRTGFLLRFACYAVVFLGVILFFPAV